MDDPQQFLTPQQALGPKTVLELGVGSKPLNCTSLCCQLEPSSLQALGPKIVLELGVGSKPLNYTSSHCKLELGSSQALGP